MHKTGSCTLIFNFASKRAIMHHVFLSLGTNLGDRNKNLVRARRLLSQDAGDISAVSSVYRTEPWGFIHPDDFYNQVLEIQTDLEPVSLLKINHDIEKILGREQHSGKYSARTIDIDILLFDDLIVETDALKIPHPLMEERLFVLVPLEEIAPLFIHPVRKLTIRQLLVNCTDHSYVKKIQGSRSGNDR